MSNLPGDKCLLILEDGQPTRFIDEGSFRGRLVEVNRRDIQGLAWATACAYMWEGYLVGYHTPYDQAWYIDAGGVDEVGEWYPENLYTQEDVAAERAVRPVIEFVFMDEGDLAQQVLLVDAVRFFEPERSEVSS